MADVDVAVEKITRAGIDAADTGSLSVSDTYKVLNNGRTFLHFKKTGAGACTVTFISPRTVDGLALADPTVVVPATTGDVMVGPFETESFNDSVGKLAFTLSEITALTVAVLRLDDE